MEVVEEEQAQLVEQECQTEIAPVEKSDNETNTDQIDRATTGIQAKPVTKNKSTAMKLTTRSSETQTEAAAEVAPADKSKQDKFNETIEFLDSLEAKDLVQVQLKITELLQKKL